jgi:hypothetical protein
VPTSKPTTTLGSTELSIAAGSTATGKTINLTGSVPTVGYTSTSSSTPAQVTGAADHVQAASFAGLAGILGLAAALF